MTPPSWTDWIVAGAAALGAAAAMGTMVAAFLGLSTWRAQLHGGSDFELARRLLAAVYRMRNAIQRARSPLISAFEYADRPGRPPDESPFDVKLSSEDYAQVFERRYKPLDDARAELDALLLEAEALWGKAIAQPVTALRSITHELYGAVGQFVEEMKGGDDPSPWGKEERARRLALRYRLREILFWRSTPEDLFAAELQSTVEKFEAIARNHLPRAERTARSHWEESK